MKTKKKTIGYIIAAAVLAILYFPLDYYLTYRHPNIASPARIQIFKNAEYSEVLDTLEASGAIRDFKRFKKAAEARELDKHFEAGSYILTEGMSNSDIIRTIANAWQTPTRLVISGNIMTMEKLASVLDRQLEADSLSIYRTLTDSLLIDSLGFNPNTFIGMFIPNTYEVYWTVEPEDLVLRMHAEYGRFWTEKRKAKAQALGMSQMEVLTLASIVAQESNFKPELPTIAGVYINRLRKGMKLQADPTVRYIVLKDEPDVKRILKRHLRTDSPYNTYRYRGLPPGPICIPNIDAIEAVLNYERHDYLYFCAKASFDGTHNFASSYTKHLKNAREYQNALSQMKS